MTFLFYLAKLSDMQSSKLSKKTSRSAAATSAPTKRSRKASAKDPIATPDVAVAETPASLDTPAILSDVQSSERVPVKTAQVAATADVTHEDIARLAFSLWEQRGYAHGNPEHDWLRAEQQLKARAAAASA